MLFDGLSYMYESLSMLFVSLCCIVELFNFDFLQSLADGIKVLSKHALLCPS